jgi:integrase/recombinase XerD
LDECRIFVRKGKDSLDRYTVIDTETARQLRELQGNQPMSARVFPIGDHQVWVIVTNAAIDSGLQQAYSEFTISPHTLRHAHGNHCYHRGVDLYALKKLLGHRYLKNTLEYVDCQLPRWREVYNQHHPLALLEK